MYLYESKEAMWISLNVEIILYNKTTLTNTIYHPYSHRGNGRDVAEQ